MGTTDHEPEALQTAVVMIVEGSPEQNFVLSLQNKENKKMFV